MLKKSKDVEQSRVLELVDARHVRMFHAVCVHQCHVNTLELLGASFLEVQYQEYTVSLKPS